MDILEILRQSRDKQFRKKMATNPMLKEAKQVAEIVVAEYLSNKIIELKGEPGYTPIKGVDYFDGLPGQDGKDGIGIDGKNGKDGKDGKDGIGIDGKDGENGQDGKDGSPDTPEQIADKVNTLEEKIEQKSIKGLIKTIEKLRNAIRDKKGGGLLRGGGDIINYYDITSQCNGVLTTFTIPRNRKVIALLGTQFPLIYRPVIDYTYTATTLTIDTSQVGAPQTGQTLTVLYVV